MGPPAKDVVFHFGVAFYTGNFEETRYHPTSRHVESTTCWLRAISKEGSRSYIAFEHLK